MSAVAVREAHGPEIYVIDVVAIDRFLIYVYVEENTWVT